MPFWLKRGANASISKEAPGIKEVQVGLGWDARMADGSPFDLDVCVFLLNAQGQARSDSDFIFYNQLSAADGAVIHMGDNLTGQGEGDDERIKIDLTKVPTEIARISVCVAIFDAEARGQNFGMIQNAYVRVINLADGVELGRYELSDSGEETAIMFAEVYRHSNEWKFRAVGQGFQLGLESLARNFGVECEVPPRSDRGQSGEKEELVIHDRKE